MLLVLLAAALVGFDVFAVVVPNVLMARRRAACAEQLHRLGELHRAAAPGPQDAGALYLLALVRDAPEGGRLLVCPADPEARPYEERGLTPEGLASADEDVLRSVCSYAAWDPRAGPRRAAPSGRTVVAADLAEHHQGGLHVLFADGTVELLDRAALGLGPTEPIAVGADARREDLRGLGLDPSAE